MSQSNGVDIQVLNKKFTVSCTEDERPALDTAVNFLNKKMVEIKDNGNFIGIEKIAVMAALNLAHEVLNIESGNVNIGECKQKITELQDKIDAACQ